MERKKDITLDDLCKIHTKFCWLAKEIVMGGKEITQDRKETCWNLMESFSNLVVSSDISYKLTVMRNMWDALFKFVNEYIRDDGTLPRRRTAVEIYEQMKPIEEARIIKTEK